MRISDWSSDVCSSDLPLRFDENRPSRAQPPEGIVEPGGDGHEFGGRGTVEIGTAKARRALKRSVLVEHHARPHQCDPGEEVCETGGFGPIFLKRHHGRTQVGYLRWRRATSTNCGSRRAAQTESTVQIAQLERKRVG